MIRIRPSKERGHADHGWLQARHSFSFAGYLDPAHMGFRTLRVLNDDRIAPGQGFGTHGHRDMEIVTWVLDGALAHRDSMGNGSTLRPGVAQRMSAGTGVRHSEFNASPTEPLRVLQIWILPEEDGIDPGWEEKEFPRSVRDGQLCLIASPEPTDGELKIHQDARIFVANLDGDDVVRHALDPGRGAWVQVARGRIELNGHLLEEGDGASIEDERELVFERGEAAEILLFDLA